MLKKVLSLATLYSLLSAAVVAACIFFSRMSVVLRPGDTVPASVASEIAQISFMQTSPQQLETRHLPAPSNAYSPAC